MRKTINGSPGLYTAANAEILPAGSLAVAKGVVIRRPGLIQKARPFRQYSYGGDSTFTDPVSGTVLPANGIMSFSGLPYLLNTAGELWRETSVNAGTFTDLHHRVGTSLITTPRSCEAHKALFITGSARVNGGAATTIGALTKIDATGGTPYAAGCPRGIDPILSTLASGSLMTVGQSAAYRVVYTFTDANGYLVFGAPSGPVTITATGTQDIQAKVLLHADIYNAANATSYRVQLYRSNVVASGSNPDDEMQLVADYGITSTDVTNKYVTISDASPDSLKGKLPNSYLYTNPSQQGIQAANYQPPIAHDIAWFKSTMFYANTTQKYRASLTMIGTPEVWAIQSIAANTPIAGQSTYTFLAAVDLTGFDNTCKLAVTGSTGASNDGTWAIVSVNNTTHTVVVTNAGVAQAAPAGSAISGKLTIAGTTYFPIFGSESVANRYYTIPTSGTSQAKVASATQSLVRIINQTAAATVVASNITDPLSAAGEMQLEEKSIGGSQWTATALGTTTAGYRGAFAYTFSPAIPSATPLTSQNDARPNRLHMSKLGQPEHCPLADGYPARGGTANGYFDIGSESAAILRIIPLRSALLVFKEDGLFRVTGDAGVFSWSPVDATQILLGADLVVTAQSTAIAYTARGIWQFSETGARCLSGPVADKVNALTGAYTTQSRFLVTDGSYLKPRLSFTPTDGVLSVFAYGHDTDAANIALTYSLDTGAWTEQYVTTSGTGADGISGQANFHAMAFTEINGTRYGVLVDGSSTSFDVYVNDVYMPAADVITDSCFADTLAQGSEPVPGHKYLINISAVNAGARTITATSLGGPAIAVGTLISDVSGAYRVTAVNGAVLSLTNVAGLDTFDFSPARRAYKYAPQPIQIDFNPFTNGEDGEAKQFVEVAAILDPLSSTTANSVSIGCYTENLTSSAMTMEAVPTATTYNRIGVEQAAQTARRLSVRVTHSNPLEYFYLRGISYLFNELPDSQTSN